MAGWFTRMFGEDEEQETAAPVPKNARPIEEAERMVQADPSLAAMFEQTYGRKPNLQPTAPKLMPKEQAEQFVRLNPNYAAQFEQTYGYKPHLDNTPRPGAAPAATPPEASITQPTMAGKFSIPTSDEEPAVEEPGVGEKFSALKETIPASFKASLAGLGEATLDMQPEEFMPEPLKLLTRGIREARALATGEPSSGPVSYGDMVDFLAPGVADEMRVRTHEATQAAEQTIQRANQDLSIDSGEPMYYVNGILQATTEMAPMVAATLLTKNPRIGMAVMGSQIFGREYSSAIEKGRSKDEAFQDAAFYTLIESVTEKLPLDFITRYGKQGLKGVFSAGVAEGVQEAAVEVLSMGYETGVLDENAFVDPETGEFSLIPALKRMGNAFAIGGGAGSLMRAGVQGARGAAAKLEDRQYRRTIDQTEQVLKNFSEADLQTIPEYQRALELGMEPPEALRYLAKIPEIQEVAKAGVETLLADAAEQAEPVEMDSVIDRIAAAEPVSPHEASVAVKQGYAKWYGDNIVLLPAGKRMRAQRAEEQLQQMSPGMMGVGAEAPQATSGEMQQPVQTGVVDAAAAEAATSPENNLPEPTDAQKEAGNYKKGKVRLHGLDVSIENPAGTSRRPEWPPLANHYGYIRRTEAADGEQLDAFLGPQAEDPSKPVFVVDQIAPETGAFDEQKALLGWDTPEQAADGYRANYSPDWQGLGGLVQFDTLEQFKDWTRNADGFRPAAETAPAFGARVVEVPAAEPGKINADDEVRYEVERDEDDEGTFVTAYSTTSMNEKDEPLAIGHLHVPDENDGQEFWRAGDVYVHPERRRTGIATKMYQRMAEHLGKPAKPASHQSPEGKALWEGMQRKAVDTSASESINPAKTDKSKSPRSLLETLSNLVNRSGQRGLSATEARAQGIDPAAFKAAGHGIQRAFTKNGMSFDEAAELLSQLGYPVTNEQGQYDPNVLLDRISEELAGNKVFSAEDQEAELERQYQQRREDEAERDLLGDDTRSAQQLADEGRRRDAARNTGQDDLETGDPSDMFSQARKQTDLMDFRERRNPFDGERERIDALPKDEQQAEIQRLRARNKELEQETRTSAKTGLPNRKAFEEDESLGWITVAAMDMDGLGWFNEHWGHDSADEILRATGETMQPYRRDDLRLYHLNGDEFAVRTSLPTAEAQAVLDELQQELDNLLVEAEGINEDLESVIFTTRGVGLTYGIGGTYKEADNAATRAKNEREKAGLRSPKGDEPIGVGRVAAEAEERQVESAEVEDDVTPRFARAPQTDSPAFKRWFGDSKVVDENGEPLVVYHTTDKDFDAFRRRTGDIGIHFGTQGQAEDRMDYGRQQGIRTDEGARTIPVYLSIKNPIRLKDAGLWNVDNLDYQLKEKFPNDADRIRRLRSTKDIREFLQSKGYDGVVYRNTGEVGGARELSERAQEARKAAFAAQKARGKAANAFDLEDQQTPEYKEMKAAEDAYSRFREENAEDSYIAFERTQIKSAVGNRGTFDPENPDIRFSRAGRRDLIIQHNVTAEKLRHADRMGGIAVPSLAITKADHPITGFGDITLLGDAAMADPRGDTKPRVFGADVYSPRYPEVTYRIDSGVSKKIDEMLKDYREDGDRFYGSGSQGIDQLTGYEPFKRYVDAKAGGVAKWANLKEEATKMLREAGAKEVLFRGYTPSGNRRYQPHTLENVVKILKKELRGGEGFNYGVGSLRAHFTPQFRSLKQIRDNKDLLTDPETFEKVKEEVDAEFWEIVETLTPYYERETGFGFGDTVINMLEDAGKMGIPRALKEWQEFGFSESLAENEDVQAEIAKFLTRLRHLPTEYFEAIIPRAVDLSEFVAAVVPEDTAKDVLNLLEDAGIEVEAYKAGDEQDRARAIKDVGKRKADVLFRRGQRPIEAPATQRTRRMIAAIANEFAGRPVVQTVESTDDLPVGVQAYIGNPQDAADTKGIYLPGSNPTIYVIAGNALNDRDATETLIHEMIGHHGVRSVLGETEFFEAMDAIAAAMPGKIREAIARNGLDRKDDSGKPFYTAEQMKRIAAEEVIAYTAQDIIAGKTTLENLSDKLRFWMERIMAAIRRILGLADPKFAKEATDAEIIRLIARSYDFVRSGRAARTARMGYALRSVNVPPFYSQLVKTINDKLPERSPPAEYLKQIQGQLGKDGLKPEEFKWSGLEDALSDMRVAHLNKTDWPLDVKQAWEALPEKVRNEIDLNLHLNRPGMTYQQFADRALADAFTRETRKEGTEPAIKGWFALLNEPVHKLSKAQLVDLIDRNLPRIVPKTPMQLQQEGVDVLDVDGDEMNEELERIMRAEGNFFELEDGEKPELDADELYDIYGEDHWENVIISRVLEGDHRARKLDNRSEVEEWLDKSDVEWEGELDVEDGLAVLEAIGENKFREMVEAIAPALAKDREFVTETVLEDWDYEDAQQDQSWIVELSDYTVTWGVIDSNDAFEVYRKSDGEVVSENTYIDVNDFIAKDKNYRAQVLKDAPPEGRTKWLEYMTPGGDPETYSENLYIWENNPGQTFKYSSHWDDAPNVLLHVRSDYNRETPDGAKLHYIDELQSDWHQQAREQGWIPTEEGKRELKEKLKTRTKELFDEHRKKFPELTETAQQAEKEMERLGAAMHGQTDAADKVGEVLLVDFLAAADSERTAKQRREALDAFADTIDLLGTDYLNAAFRTLGTITDEGWPDNRNMWAEATSEIKNFLYKREETGDSKTFTEWLNERDESFGVFTILLEGVKLNRRPEDVPGFAGTTRPVMPHFKVGSWANTEHDLSIYTDDAAESFEKIADHRANPPAITFIEHAAYLNKKVKPLLARAAEVAKRYDLLDESYKVEPIQSAVFPTDADLSPASMPQYILDFEEARERFHQADRGHGIPFAPMAASYQLVALKHQLQLAAQEGMDEIAFATGERHAQRWSALDGTRSVMVMPDKRDDGTIIVSHAHHHLKVSPSRLKFVVGDDVAAEITERLAKGEKSAFEVTRKENFSVSRSDMGIGLREAYNSIMPKMFNKFLKKYGMKFELGEMMAEGGDPLATNIPDSKVFVVTNDTSGFIERAGPFKTLDEAKADPLSKEKGSNISEQEVVKTVVPVWRAKITPAAREAARTTGFPLFAKAPKKEQEIVEAFRAKRHGAVEKTLPELVKEWTQDWKARLNQYVFDDLYGLKRAELDVGQTPKAQTGYVSARLAKGVDDLLRTVLEFGAPAWDSKDVATRAPTYDRASKSFFSILAPLRDEKLLELWKDYIVAKRARRLKAEERENLFTGEEIETILKRSEEFPLLETVSGEYAALNKRILDFAEAAGVVNPETRKLWENADYVPFYRVVDDAGRGKVSGPFTGTGRLANIGAVIKTLRGGRNNIGDPINNIIMNWAALLRAALNNHAALLAIDNLDGTGIVTKAKQVEFKKELVSREEVARRLKAEGARVDDMSLDGFMELFAMKPPSGDNVINVFRNGKREYWEIHDPLLFRSMTAIGKAPFGSWMNIFRVPKRLMTQLITLSPDFSIRNWFRDAWSSFVLRRDTKAIPMLDGAKGFTKTLTKHEDFKDMMAGGATFESGYVTAHDPGAVQKVIRARMRNANFKNSIIDKPMKFFEMYRDVTSSAENANRVPIYRDTLNATGSRKLALYEAKDIMDFSMRGDGAVMRFLAESVAFFNARLQGMYRIPRTWTEAATGKEKRKLATAVLVRGAMIMIPTLYLYLRNRKLKCYQDLPNYDKDLYYHFFVGDASQGCENMRHYRLPKPFEVGALFSTVPERMLEAGLSAEPDAGVQLADRLLWIFGEMLNMNPVPTTLEPWVELTMNRDQFRDAPILNMHDQRLLPEMQYDYRTPPTYRFISQYMQDVPGAPDWLRSPKQLEHIVSAYIGTLGNDYALLATDAMVRAAQDYPPPPAKRLDEIPGVKSFVRDQPLKYTQHMDAMYSIYEEVSKYASTVKALEDQISLMDSAGNKEMTSRLEARLEWYEKTKDPELIAADELGAAIKEIAGINEEIMMITLDAKMDPEEKRKQIDALYEERNEVAEEAIQYRPGGPENPREEDKDEEKPEAVMDRISGMTRKQQVDALNAASLPQTAMLVESLPTRLPRRLQEELEKAMKERAV